MGERDRVQDVLDDLHDKLQEAQDPKEGLRDIGALNIQSATQDGVTRTETKLASLIAVIEKSIAQLTELLATIYPEWPKLEATPEMVQDVDDQIRTIQAARNQFFAAPPTATVIVSTPKLIPKL